MSPIIDARAAGYYVKVESNLVCPIEPSDTRGRAHLAQRPTVVRLHSGYSRPSHVECLWRRRVLGRELTAHVSAVGALSHFCVSVFVCLCAGRAGLSSSDESEDSDRGGNVSGGDEGTQATIDDSHASGSPRTFKRREGVSHAY